MKTCCEDCGGKFTKKEIAKLQEEMEWCEPIYICQECYEMQGNFEPGEREYFSDADPGL